jgi:hypothetical protein
MQDRFLVLGTANGHVCVWSALQLLEKIATAGTNRHTPIPPCHTVDTGVEYRAAIVQIAAAPLGTQLIETSKQVATAASSMGHCQVVAVTVQGDVFVVDIPTTAAGGDASLAFSFNTDRCGITSVVVVPNEADALNIVVGYQSGYLESWALSQATTADSETSKDPGAIVTAKLVWRGAFGSQSPIRAVAPLLPIDPPSRPVLAQYLAVTLQPETYRSSASLLEVVDMTSAAKSWMQVREDAVATTTLALEDHWILPEAGMELIDAGTLTETAVNSYTKRAVPNWIPSNGTDCLYSLQQQQQTSNSSSSSESAASVAFGLSDGTTGILSATTDPLNGTLSWGIAKAVDQVLFQYPCIGLGHVHTTADPSSNGNDKRTQSHVAYCLRGGTTYLVPITPVVAEDAPKEDALLAADPPVTVLSYPHDMDSDTDTQYLHGFAAGNIRVLGEEDRSIPLLFYAWPDSVVDVYSSELLIAHQQRQPLKETNYRLRPILLELMGNGSVQLLQSFVTTRPVDIWRNRPDWIAAHGALVGSSDTEQDEAGAVIAKDDFSNAILTIDQLLSPRLKAFRTLLLDIADAESPMDALTATPFAY